MLLKVVVVPVLAHATPSAAAAAAAASGDRRISDAFSSASVLSLFIATLCTCADCDSTTELMMLLLLMAHLLQNTLL